MSAPGAVQAVAVALGVGVVKFVADKITPVITSEISSIKGVTKGLSELQDIHKSISSCLDIGKGGDPSLSLETKLKKVADDINDLLNEVKHAEIKKIDSDGYAVVDCSPTKPKSFISRIKIAHRIKAIRKTHAAILKQKSDTNTILNNLTINQPVAVQGMRAGEQSLLSKGEEQKVQETVQGEDSKCTLSDSNEGMDDWITDFTVTGKEDECADKVLLEDVDDDSCDLEDAAYSHAKVNELTVQPPQGDATDEGMILLPVQRPGGGHGEHGIEFPAGQNGEQVSAPGTILLPSSSAVGLADIQSADGSDTQGAVELSRGAGWLAGKIQTSGECKQGRPELSTSTGRLVSVQGVGEVGEQGAEKNVGLPGKLGEGEIGVGSSSRADPDPGVLETAPGTRGQVNTGLEDMGEMDNTAWEVAVQVEPSSPAAALAAQEDEGVGGDSAPPANGDKFLPKPSESCTSDQRGNDNTQACKSTFGHEQQHRQHAKSEEEDILEKQEFSSGMLITTSKDEETPEAGSTQESCV